MTPHSVQCFHCVNLSASFIYVKCSKMNWIMTVLFCPKGKVRLRLQHTTNTKHMGKNVSPYFSTKHEDSYLHKYVKTSLADLSAYCDRQRIQILHLRQYFFITAHYSNPKSCYLRLATHFKHNVGVTCSSWAARMFHAVWKTDWV